MQPASGNLSSLLTRGWSALLDLVYPPHCVACGHLGEWLCAECLRGVPWLDGPCCSRCGQPMAKAGSLCNECAGGGLALESARAVSLHVPPLREAIYGLKYDGLRALVAPLALLLAEAWRRTSWPIDVIVPVPLHERRIRRRGYNQSLLLADALSRHLGVPLEGRVLVRERNTRTQVGLKRQERWLNVAGAFRCRDASLQGKSILLVDDVFTTGATLEACAVALVASGSAQVRALTLTRAIDQDSHAGRGLGTAADDV
jgi:competence protein ComFC